MADALGGEIDAETYELSYNAAGSDVAEALEVASAALGNVEVTRTISGKLCVVVDACPFFCARSLRSFVLKHHLSSVVVWGKLGNPSFLVAFKLGGYHFCHAPLLVQGQTNTTAAGARLFLHCQP